MARYIVGTLDEIPPGGRKIVDVAGRSIGVFNVGGELFALRNRCPHQGGPLCTGRLAGFLEPGRQGEYHYSRPGEILRCSWHGWEYDLRTGQSYFAPAQIRVRSYEVMIESGEALVPGAKTADVFPHGHRPAEIGVPAGYERGPYVAETYPVSVDKAYVLVEIDA